MSRGVTGNIEIVKLSKQDWVKFSENAHLICFNETKPADMDRIDFALVAQTGDAKLLGYVTCRETDSQTVYWQYGGAFPSARASSLSLASYMRLVWWTKQHYDRVHTFIENSNIVMLKMAMKVGFRIIGVKNFNGHILLEHHMEFVE